MRYIITYISQIAEFSIKPTDNVLVLMDEQENIPISVTIAMLKSKATFEFIEPLAGRSKEFMQGYIYGKTESKIKKTDSVIIAGDPILDKPAAKKTSAGRTKKTSAKEPEIVEEKITKPRFGKANVVITDPAKKSTEDKKDEFPTGPADEASTKASEKAEKEWDKEVMNLLSSEEQIIGEPEIMPAPTSEEEPAVQTKKRGRPAKVTPIEPVMIPNEEPSAKKFELPEAEKKKAEKTLKPREDFTDEDKEEIKKFIRGTFRKETDETLDNIVKSIIDTDTSNAANGVLFCFLLNVGRDANPTEAKRLKEAIKKFKVIQ